MATKPHGKARRRHCGPIQAAANKLKYARQVQRTEANRLKKRQRHVRDHPNDLVTVKLL